MDHPWIPVRQPRQEKTTTITTIENEPRRRRTTRTRAEAAEGTNYRVTTASLVESTYTVSMEKWGFLLSSAVQCSAVQCSADQTLS